MGCVTPVAFLEWSRFGLPLRSALVVAAGEAEPAAAPAERLAAQVDLWVRLHEAGFSMPSLQPAEVALAERADRIEAQVVGLAKLRFPARASRAERAAGLALLDAEWARLGVSERLRERARARYRRREFVSSC